MNSKVIKIKDIIETLNDRIKEHGLVQLNKLLERCESLTICLKQVSLQIAIKMAGSIC